MSDHYRAPPIVEAVIELRFSDPVSFETIEKKRDKFARHYPLVENNFDITAQISASQHSIRQEPSGFRLRSKDELEVLSLEKTKLLFAQLAPYPGWQTFESRMQRDFDIFIENIGWRNFSRLGIRFINRLDIPESRVDVSDYLKIFPTMPHFDGSVAAKFALESTINLEDRRYFATLRTGSIESPVPRMISFVLDIDLFRSVELPTRKDHLIGVLTEMREIKNNVFEASITDKARKLFG